MLFLYNKQLQIIIQLIVGSRRVPGAPSGENSGHLTSSCGHLSYLAGGHSLSVHYCKNRSVTSILVAQERFYWTEYRTCLVLLWRWSETQFCLMINMHSVSMQTFVLIIHNEMSSDFTFVIGFSIPCTSCPAT